MFSYGWIICRYDVCVSNIITRLLRFVLTCCSFPQIPQTKQTSLNGERTDQEKATLSISAYVERCSHFFVLCPSVRTKDKKELEYDYGSWLASGACRMELFALLLAGNNSIPAIVSAEFMLRNLLRIPRPGRCAFCNFSSRTNAHRW